MGAYTPVPIPSYWIMRFGFTTGRATTCTLGGGAGRTVLLRNDGTAIAVGGNGCGQCNVPDLPAGAQYVAVAAGGSHTVLLRNDGTAIAVGNNGFGQCTMPDLPAGAQS